MNPKRCFIALALFALTACQGHTPAGQQAVKPLDSEDLSRLAYEHDIACRNETRDSNDSFIPPGTPVAITGVCEIARDVPVFRIDCPDRSADGVPDGHRSFRAHLEDNPEVVQMKKGQRYLVKGRIAGGDSTMCYGAYFIAVDSFTALD